MSLEIPDFQGAHLSPSPNYGARADGAAVDILLLHYTGMASGEAALSWLCDRQSGVSSHYLVFEDGTVHQLVAERERAWHAGKSVWKGERDINSRSIGIEIVNPGHEHGYRAFPEPQIDAVIALCRDCAGRRAVAPERVLAHSDVAPRRKRDPGERFPWDRLFSDGVGHWVAPSPPGSGRFFHAGDRGEPVRALQSMLSLYGYGTEITGEFDVATAGDVEAFQRHFRPDRVDGVADRSTIETLHRLLAALPDYR